MEVFRGVEITFYKLATTSIPVSLDRVHIGTFLSNYATYAYVPACNNYVVHSVGYREDEEVYIYIALGDIDKTKALLTDLQNVKYGSTLTLKTNATIWVA